MRFADTRRAVLAAALSLLICALFAASAGAYERSLFGVQQTGATGVAWYSIDLGTGELTQHPGITPAGIAPTTPGISPNGGLFYTADFFGNNVHGFSIGSGGLTGVAGSPFAAGYAPNATVFSPAGDAVWSADNLGGTIGGFSVAGDGALTPSPGAPFPVAGSATTVAVSPRNSLTYVPGYDGDTLDAFTRGAGGALNHLPGFPLPHAGQPTDVEFDVSGTHLFVANAAADSISSYSVDQSTGALTEVAGSPFATSSGPSALAATPDGQFLLVADLSANGVQSFAIGANGELTPTGPPVATGSAPYDVTVTPDSNFAYSANYGSGTISGFSIGPGGTLTELSGSPWGDAYSAVVSAAIVPDQGPVAALASSTSGNTVSLDAGASSDPDGYVAGYHWDFGDGAYSGTSTPNVTHTYQPGGTYTISVTVTDNERCSTQQVGTGQTLACNGSIAARATRQVTIPPLKLTHASGAQIRGENRGGNKRLRVNVEFFLTLPANVAYQFQKSVRGGVCRKRTTTHKHKPKFKNFGRNTSYASVSGRNLRTFTGKLGGKKIVPGRYRVKLRAKDSSGAQTPTVTTASFCVR